MSAPVLAQRFEQQRGRLPGPFDARRRALDALLANGFPTRRDEAWRYTDLKPIAEADFETASDTPTAALRARVQTLLDEVAPEHGATRIVFVDGRLDEQLSRLDAPAGIQIDRATAETRLQPPAGPEAHPLALLNRAFASDGIAIRALRKAGGEVPLEIFLVAGGDARVAQHPRISIELASHAQLEVVVHCLDAAETEGWLNVVIEISQAEGSRLAVHRLQEHGDGLHHTSLLRAEIGKDAALEAGYVDLGGRVVRNDLDIRLTEPGASAELFGVFVASPGRHIDDEVHVEHVAPHTRSDTAFRGIADRNGRGVFRGKVLVQRDAQKIDARQSSDNLLLAEQAEIDTRPELEIYADDVKCSHGATVGEIDAEQMFYLRSRGIDEEAARALLTFAFANTLLRRFRPERLRERATSRVAGQLPSQMQWEEIR